MEIDFAYKLHINNEAIRKFYEENWPRKIVLSNAKFYKWQFLDAPDCQSHDHCVVAYNRRDQQIVGVMGLTKRTFFLSGHTVNGAELTTWIVSDHGRRLGAGAKMLLFIKENFSVAVGTGISEMALPVYMRSGFRYIKALPRFMKVINFETIKNYATYTELAPKLIKQWAETHAPVFSAREASIDDCAQIFHAKINEFNFFCRDTHYLKWRYTQHPAFVYKKFIINTPDNLSTAAVIIREEKNISDFSVLHITDLFGDEQALPLAIKFIENYAKKNNFAIIDFYCTSTKIYRFMLCGGWFSVNDDMSFRFPHLFHPIEMRDPPTTSIIYWAKSNFCSMTDFSRLYITKSDVDLDRPTTHNPIVT